MKLLTAIGDKALAAPTMQMDSGKGWRARGKHCPDFRQALGKIIAIRLALNQILKPLMEACGRCGEGVGPALVRTW